MKLRLKNSLSLIIGFVLCLSNVSAQTSETELFQPFSPSLRLAYSDNLPEFVKMTLLPNPNFNAIEAAFEVFEKAEKAEKAKKRRTTDAISRNNREGVQNSNAKSEEADEDLYEVYYERWKRAYQPFVQADGSILLPTVAEYKRKIHTENRANQQRAALRSGAANWTCIGPKETYWLKDNNAAQPACPWQTNIYAFDISKSNPSILYAAPETGGVFKTTDKGLNWTVCGSSSFNFGGTAGAIEIHPTDPNTVYVAVNSFLWKTTDGGNNWVDLTNCTASGVNDIAISPADPNIVMVAADNGFFRSTNTGGTWTQIYTTPCSDIEFNPTDATHVFILKSNGTYGEFLKSTDSGVSFTVKSTGFTTLTSGRLAVTAADGNRIYALFTTTGTKLPKLLKSTDEGETWTNMNGTFCSGGVSDVTGGQGYYDLSIAVSQTNANELLYGLCSTYKAVSTDGGATFTYTYISGYCGDFTIHPDLQEVKTVMNNGVTETWTATDGGLTYSNDFFTSTTNASARNNGIFAVDFWGFSQGWNEDIMVGGRYHNGNTAMADFYPAGKSLRMGGAEAGTGYLLHGNSRYAIFSDLGDGWILPPDFYSTSAGRFKYNKFPNEDGYGFNASSFVNHPYYFKQQFLAEGNSLWKTTDNGLTFVALKDFASRTRRFDVSRSNPSVIYVATDAGFNKSTDGGTTWSAVALPSGKSSGNLYLAINPNNDQDVWICFKDVSGAGKIYQSTNGGGSWTVKDGTALNSGSLKIKNIIHTGGGVYIAPENALGRLFYRSSSATDWTDFSTNLPASLSILKMLPFYRDGKLRVATNRGIWETPLESDVAPIAQPMVNKPSTTCPRDTFFFDDYSILKHAGATWAWSFSTSTNASFTPQYISSASARNPKVVFGTVGKYAVTLTVTNSAGTSSKTITDMIDVTSDGNCELSTVIGKAMSNTANGDYLLSPAVNLNKDDGTDNNEITIMGWIRPAGIQSSYAGIFSCNGVNVNLNFRDNNELGIHWNDGQYGWSSGLIVPPNEWSHVALVATGTSAKLYLNGREASTTTTLTALNLANSQWYIGNDRGQVARTYKGLIDEVCFYNRALTANELQEKMHLMKNPADEVGLKGYYQFDETNNDVWNKALNNLSFATLTGAAIRTTSTAPVAVGTSQRMRITTGGIKDFSAQNLIIQFPNSGTLPNGDIIVNELTASPDQMPSGGTPLSNKYWIIENYGTNAAFSPLNSLKFNNLSSFATGTASEFKLYKRAVNADGATWGTTIDGADDLTTNNLTFTPPIPCMGITSFGQFTTTKDAATAAPSAAAAECNFSTVIGRAMVTTNNGDYMLTPAIDLNGAGTSTDIITIMAWIRPNVGLQSSYAGILSCSGINVNLNYRDNNELGIHWNDGQYGWSSGLTVTPNEWSHVALVVTGTRFKLYLNGKEAPNASSNTADPAPLNLANRQWYIGNDRGNTTRTFKGLMDEVCFYNRALSQDEIREKMHFVKTTDATLKGYFQFNETNNVIWNKPDGSFTAFAGGAARATSTAPVATGTSQRMSITTSGVKDFPNQHLTLDFASGSTLPNDEIVVNELNAAPDENPMGGTPLSTKYWIVNNYGVNAGLTLNSLSFSNLLGFATGSPANYNLFKRKSGYDATSASPSWGNALDVADALTNTNNKTLTFSTGNNVTSFSQFTISSISIVAVELLNFNAVLKDKQVDLTWQVADEKDVNHYVIERSFDGKSFDFLTKQEKSSTTVHQLSYIAHDGTPQYGVNYYRLKIVENDGKATYSPIRSVLVNEKNKTDFKIYPNPTASILNIQFNTEQSQAVDFELINTVGQAVYSYRLQSREGKNHLFFNTSLFPVGLYTLKIRQGNVVTVEKVVIQ